MRTQHQQRARIMRHERALQRALARISILTRRRWHAAAS